MTRSIDEHMIYNSGFRAGLRDCFAGHDEKHNVLRSIIQTRDNHIARLKRELERRDKEIVLRNHRLQTYEQMTHSQRKVINKLEKQVEELERTYHGPQFVRGGSSMRFTGEAPYCTDYICDRHSGKRVVEVHDDERLRNRIVDLLNED